MGTMGLREELLLTANKRKKKKPIPSSSISDTKRCFKATAAFYIHNWSFSVLARSVDLPREWSSESSSISPRIVTQLKNTRTRREGFQVFSDEGEITKYTICVLQDVRSFLFYHSLSLPTKISLNLFPRGIWIFLLPCEWNLFLWSNLN